MLQRRIFLACFVLLTIIKSNSQVNLQTGSATFSLPMFNWQDDNSRLTSVLALSYNSGNGLKVNDVASNLGQGWTMVAGGAITRMQEGEPDDQKPFIGNGDHTDQDITKYPAGKLYAPVPAGNGCPTALTRYPIYRHKNQLYIQHNSTGEDRQLDYFSFQFNGKTGIFVLDTTGGDHGDMLGDSKIKITFQRDTTMINQGIRTTITSFTIQDVDGLIYKFTQHGLTKLLHELYCDAKGAQFRTQPTFKSGKVYYQKAFDDGQIVYPYVITNWYLSEIDDPLTGRKVTFNYVTHNINNQAGTEISYNSNSNYVIITSKASITQTLDISSISYPDGHSVVFNYGNARWDLSGEYALSTVDISYQGRYISEYRFNTSYFILNRYGTPTSTYQKSVARLCLRSVKKIGIDLKEDTPPYQFDYYTGAGGDDVVPAAFTYAKDVWGFYNGNNSHDNTGATFDLTTTVPNLTFNEAVGLCFKNNTTTGVVLNANPGYAKNGLLRQIIYPTGGTLTYQYSQNTGVLNGSTANVGGVHVSQTSTTDGGYSNGCSNPVTTSYNYVLSDGVTSSLWGLEMPVNTTPISSHYAAEGKSYHYTWGSNWSIFGSCYWKWEYPGILFRQQAISLEGFQRIMENIAPVLGIISLVTTIADFATIIGGGTGVLAVAAVCVDILAGWVTLFATCKASSITKDETTTIYYNADLNAVSPLPAQFKRVEVTESPGTIGKTVTQFTSSDEYPIWIPSNPSFSPKQRFAPWAYGLPKLITVYDASGNKIKETQNVYNFNTIYSAKCTITPHYDRTQILKTALNNVSAKCMVNHTSSQNNRDWSNPSIYDDPSTFYKTSLPDGSMSVDVYDMYTGRAELDTVYERTYRTTDATQYVQTMTSYVYNDENYEPELISTLQSDGNYRQKNIYYTIDFIKMHGICYALTQYATNNAAIKTLVQNNIISQPVETNELIFKSGSGYYTYDKATMFTTLANGDIKPLTNLEGRFTQPASKASPWPSDADDYYNFSYFLPAPLLYPDNPDYTFYKIAKTYTYDGSGDLTGIKDEGNRSVTNIYDYNNKYIIGTVINADPTIDKPAYTSFENNSFGGWTFAGTATYSTSNTITGGSALVLSSSNSLTANLNTARSYVVSVWSTTSSISVNGLSPIKSAPTINGFTYYEYSIAQGTSTVTISGTGTIDELRLYPQTARMKTVTYDPLIGKTSECDENNRVIYYSYDNLGRLRFVKDENGNVVKMYEYNNISPSKLNGCPTTYNNKLISEIFTKSNCGSGYVGGNVTYTIPANKYSSTISQADADAQAENEILSSGQAYADANGTCIQVYYNAAQSETDSSQTCGEGYYGGYVTYTVPAGKYSSIISQTDADQQALDELDANAQAYANDPAHRVCTATTDPDWTWDDINTYCLSVNGQLPPHQFVYETDLNPSSTTYNHTRWSDVGATDYCPSNTYYNANQSQTFTKNNCPAGYSGSNVTYTVPPGKYSSTVSQAAADQQATNDINANGQNYANANGTCIAQPVVSYSNTTAASFRIQLTSNSTGLIYCYTVSANSSGTLGPVPSGSYTVQACPGQTCSGGASSPVKPKNSNQVTPYISGSGYTLSAYGLFASSTNMTNCTSVSVTINSNGTISTYPNQ